MSLIGANELKKRLMIIVEAKPYIVVDVTFSSPSARGASMMVKARLRNLITGEMLDKNMKTSEKFEEADIEKAPASYLYADADALYFMDETTYEQFAMPLGKMTDIKGYLKENSPVEIIKFNGEPVSIELPQYVELKVVYTEPAVKGDSSGSVMKLAKLETGIEARVPLYLKEGDIVRINTQTGEAAGRA